MDGIQLSLCVVQWWTFSETGSMKGTEFLDQPTESPRLIVRIKIQALRAAVIDKRNVMYFFYFSIPKCHNIQTQHVSQYRNVYFYIHWYICQSYMFRHSRSSSGPPRSVFLESLRMTY